MIDVAPPDAGGDDELFERVAAGDPQAVEVFLQKFRPALERHVKIQLRKLRRSTPGAYLATGAEAETESVIQEAHFRFINYLSDKATLVIKDPKSLPAFLNTTARLILTNRIRANQRHRRTDTALPDRRDPAPTAEQIAEIKERREELRRFIARLPDAERQVMELCLRGLQPTEIAERLGLKPSTVRAYIARALAKLNEWFRLEGDAP